MHGELLDHSACLIHRHICVIPPFPPTVALYKMHHRLAVQSAVPLLTEMTCKYYTVNAMIKVALASAMQIRRIGGVA
jgi:hypothetical protein